MKQLLLGDVLLPCLLLQLSSGQMLDTTDCGTAKGCLLGPASCTAGTCTMAALWQTTAGSTDTVDIELFGDNGPDGYVALALSTDTSMTDDSVTACIHHTGTTGVAVQSYNTAKSPSVHLDDQSYGIQLLEQSSVNGEIYCKIRRSFSAPAGGSVDDMAEFFDAKTPHYVLLARGPSPSGGKNG